MPEKKRIYLDNAATTPVIPQVIKAMEPFWNQTFGNPSSLHEEGRRARVIVEESRRTIAKLLNVKPAEIFFTSGGTESANTVITGGFLEIGWKSIIITATEHKCVIKPAQRLTKHDVSVITVPTDRRGKVLLQELRTAIEQSERPTLVATIHGNNEIGTINPLDDIASIVKKHRDVYWLVDMVQTIGHIQVDLSHWDIDFAFASAHKFHGPKGCGFLFMKEGLPSIPLIMGGAQERNMRGGTENVPGIVGMATALKWMIDNLDKHYNHIANLKRTFIKNLKEISSEIAINGPEGEDSLPTIVNVRFPQVKDPLLLQMSLDIGGVSASIGSACASGTTEFSHVLKAIGVPADEAPIRFSFSPLNTIEEVGRALEVIKSVIFKI
ncbi:MAG: cysteine desulfurase [Chlorobi bacterium]|nr:cysteine desulfurase [Chlorobiota bacterium]